MRHEAPKTLTMQERQTLLAWSYSLEEQEPRRAREVEREILSHGYRSEYWRLSPLLAEVAEADGDVGAPEHHLASSDELPREVDEQTREILRMAQAYAEFYDGPRAADVGEDLQPPLKVFRGIDQHKTQHLGFAEFLVLRLGKWQKLRETVAQNRSSEGEPPDTEVYLQMVEVWREAGRRMTRTIAHEISRLSMEL